MSKPVAARLSLLASLLALSACSIAGPSEHKFVTTQPTLAAISALPAPKANRKAEAKQEKEEKKKQPKTEEEAMRAAVSDCKSQARDKGIKSVLAIFSHMRPGAVDADYVACMQSKGYDVAK